MTMSKTRQNRFLKNYAKTGRINQAAAVAGVCVNTIGNLRKSSPEFMALFMEADEKYCESIEAEIERRAMRGVEEPVWQGGQEVGRKRKYSDKLLIAHAKSRMSKYRDKLEAEVTHKGAVLAIPMTSTSEEEFEDAVEEAKE